MFVAWYAVGREAASGGALAPELPQESAQKSIFGNISLSLASLERPFFFQKIRLRLEGLQRLNLICA